MNWYTPASSADADGGRRGQSSTAPLRVRTRSPAGERPAPARTARRLFEARSTRADACGAIVSIVAWLADRDFSVIDAVWTGSSRRDCLPNGGPRGRRRAGLIKAKFAHSCTASPATDRGGRCPYRSCAILLVPLLIPAVPSGPQKNNADPVFRRFPARRLLPALAVCSACARETRSGRPSLVTSRDLVAPASSSRGRSLLLALGSALAIPIVRRSASFSSSSGARPADYSVLFSRPYMLPLFLRTIGGLRPLASC